LRADDAGLEGVIFLGSPTDVDCPACGDQLVTALIDDHGCRACPSCFGVAMEKPAFGQLIQARRANYRGADRPPVQWRTRAPQVERECPQCREPMEVHPYYGPGNTIIDSCRGCGLVWLDSGEITAIEQAPGLR
jgi:Zn-finger nucleic acid-binding protein